MSKEIDIVGIVELLWRKKWRIVKNCFYGGVAAIIIAYSIPKEYSSTVVLAPEFSSSMGLSGSLGSLASLAGIDVNASSEDAFYPALYPQIVSSTPFMCELLSQRVEGEYKRETISTSLYNYLRSYQRESWWSYLLSAPGKMIQRMRSLPTDTIPPSVLEGKNLSRRQQLAILSLNKRVRLDVDKGTSVISLTVTMQDARIAADVAEMVATMLQEYISDYRTAKARRDLEQTEIVYAEAQKNYLAAKQAYADYCDQHQNIVKMRFQIEQDRLLNEQDLAFGIYNQVSQQLELSKAKLLESTPVVVTVQPAVVPYKASSPKKMMIGLLFVFMAFFGTVSWILIAERLL